MSDTIEKNVSGYLEHLGLKPLSKDYYSYIYSWIDWYKGQVDTFHNYRMYNGFQFVSKKRATLNMPKRIGEEWASILFNDNVSINVEEAGQEKLNKSLELNRFDHKFSELLERTFALGTGATVVYKDTRGSPKINYIIAPMIFPLREDNGEIVDCAFASVVNGAYYVNIHLRNDITGIYTIKNKQFKSPIGKGKYVEDKLKGVLTEYYSPIKMFQIYKPNIANNIDLFTPFGLSVFANGIDQNKTIDLIYDSLKNEFDLGKKRLFLSIDTLSYKTVVGIDAKGNSTTEEVPIFDSEQTEFYALPGEVEDGKGPITEINPTLRITEHIDGLQTALNLFSDSCGLGPDRFIFKDGKVYTNSDQVISTQSKLYKNIKDHEKLLKYSMIELVKAIFYVMNGSEYTEDITIDFDDSIIEDSEKTRQQALLEFNNDLIDDIQYYMDVYKMTEDQAIKFRDQMKKRTPQEEQEDDPPDEE